MRNTLSSDSLPHVSDDLPPSQRQLRRDRRRDVVEGREPCGSSTNVTSADAYRREVKQSSICEDWDLWGPLVVSLTLAPRRATCRLLVGRRLSLVFVVLWVGAIVVSVNAQLLGGKLDAFHHNPCGYAACAHVHACRCAERPDHRRRHTPWSACRGSCVLGRRRITGLGSRALRYCSSMASCSARRTASGLAVKTKSS